MPSSPLQELIATAPIQHFKGTGYRSIDTRYHARPLSVEGSRRKSGRFHAARETDAIYLALDPATALFETGMLLQSDDRITALPSNPRTFVTIHFDLPRVLDLRDPTTRTHLGFDRIKPTWRRATPNAPTQQLGLAAFRLGIQGIAYPSSMNPNGANLVVFPANLTVGEPGRLQVVDADGKLAHVPPWATSSGGPARTAFTGASDSRRPSGNDFPAIQPKPSRGAGVTRRWAFR